MEILENINELSSKLKDMNVDFKSLQGNFLKSTIGEIANSALDVGLKKILPDFIENDVIEIKDTILSEGLTEGVNKAVESAVNLGKTAIGIFKGDFENIEQAQEALKEGGVIKGISNSIDFVLKKLEESNIISNTISTAIKGGKDLILNNIENNIDSEFSIEIKALNKIENYIEKWEKNYLEKNIEGLNKAYNKIQKEVKKIIPLENIMNNIEKIESINAIINNSENFNFDPIYLELAKNL